MNENLGELPANGAGFSFGERACQARQNIAQIDAKVPRAHRMVQQRGVGIGTIGALSS